VDENVTGAWNVLVARTRRVLELFVPSVEFALARKAPLSLMDVDVSVPVKVGFELLILVASPVSTYAQLAAAVLPFACDWVGTVIELNDLEPVMVWLLERSTMVVRIVPMLFVSAWSAVAISFKVSSVLGAPAISDAIALSTYCVDAARVELLFAVCVGIIGASVNVFTPDHVSAPKLWQTLASIAKVGSWLLMVLIELVLLEMLVVLLLMALVFVAIAVDKVAKLLLRSRPPRSMEGTVNVPPMLTFPLNELVPVTDKFPPSLRVQLPSKVMLFWNETGP
jgi:hypothetical protein